MVRPSRIAQFSAKAGEGTITASGTVGVMAPGMPTDLTVTARNAKPLASDLVSPLLNADLTVRGEALGPARRWRLGARNRANIQIPERIPTSISCATGASARCGNRHRRRLRRHRSSRWI